MKENLSSILWFGLFAFIFWTETLICNILQLNPILYNSWLQWDYTLQVWRTKMYLLALSCLLLELLVLSTTKESEQSLGCLLHVSSFGSNLKAKTSKELYSLVLIPLMLHRKATFLTEHFTKWSSNRESDTSQVIIIQKQMEKLWLWCRTS